MARLLRGTVGMDVERAASAAVEERIQRAEKMEAVGRLAAGIAHDFNNLLTAITGYTELMIEAMSPDDPAIQDAYEVRRAALSAGRLTGQLLAFSRPHRRHVAVLDVNAVIRRTVAMLRRTLGEDIELQVDLAGGLKPVKADPAHLEQILLNLAVNARDAMPDGGRLVFKTSSYVSGSPSDITAAGEYVRLSVSDTGSGIPRAIRPKIFEPFFTTKGERGTGLGLAIVYGIVQQNGGYIDLESTDGRGTTFIIDLPATLAPVDELPDMAARPPRFIEGCATVLLVEDDPCVRQLIRAVLKRVGHHVIEAGNAREALAVLASGREIDLLLTDVVMPGMNGFDLAREARAVDPDIRVAYTSGFSVDQVRQVVTDPFLPKPFTAEMLTQVVHAALTARLPPATA